MHHHRHGHGAHGFSQDASGRFAFKSPFGSITVAPGMGAVTVQRARRGDVRAAILRLLLEQPMHGYQVIQEISERSGGAWSPSAGSVYPALQLLADEGLVIAEESAGKKVFRLTEAGATAAGDAAEQPAPWEDATPQWSGHSGYHEAVGKLMRAVFQIGKSGTPEQVKAGVEVLNDARKRLYAILADD